MELIAILICCLIGSVLTANSATVRPEYPRPDFERNEWINLNGPWSYTFDFSDTGKEKGYESSKGFDGSIIVPFCPESKLSGVEHKDFINSIWYQKEVSVPSEWLNKDIMLNFGAVYNDAEVFINGNLVGRHYGGSTPFSYNITPYITPGEPVNIVVHASSNVRTGLQAAGKQSLQSASNGCNYTRTTGIWQTVWLEPVPKGALKSVDLSANPETGVIIVSPEYNGELENACLVVNILDGNKMVSKKEETVKSNKPIVVFIKNVKLWSPETPALYDIIYTVVDENGKEIDKVKSYFGFRDIEIKDNRIFINGEPCFQRLVLDQGFYPDGIWTAPSDEDLKNDILLSKSAGFNGARLHQKVFEPRFHYWADKLGYITWGEAPSWGLDANNPIAERNFLSEWNEIVERDKHHPSIIVWTPLNEEWWPDVENYPRFVTELYDNTKRIDPTRPVNDASGGCHVKTDLWTVHTYEQDPEKLRETIFNPEKEGEYTDKFMQLTHTRGVTIPNGGFNNRISDYPFPFPKYDGKMPFIVDEFGGIKWNPGEIQNNGDSWGYGDTPKSEQEFLDRLDSQVNSLLSLDGNISGYCYTQLTDVEQECNGLFYYDRTPKFNINEIYKIFSQQPNNIEK